MKGAIIILWFLPLMSWSQIDDSFYIRQVDSIIQVSRKLTSNNEFSKALELSVVAEKIALEKFDINSVSYGSACFNHGRILYFKKDYTDSEIWYLKSLAIRERVLGKEHLDYIANMFNLALLYQVTQQYHKAESLYLDIMVMREKLLGRQHIDYSNCIFNLSQLYKKIGKYDKAEFLLLEAKSIDEKILGNQHPHVIDEYENLGNLYKNMGQFNKSESMFLEALSILEKVGGKEQRNYAQCLGNYSDLLWSMGKYEKAEELIIEVKNIFEKTLGKENQDYAHSANNLGALYWKLGQYAKAEELFLESKNIREKVFGKNHSSYAASLNNLALVYEQQGHFDKAEASKLEVLSIDEKIFGKEHPEYATDLFSLGNLYWHMKNYKKAEAFWIESKILREKLLGNEHPDYAAVLNNLGALYKEINRLDRAELLLLESKAIREKVLGVFHIDYSESLNNLALLYQKKNELEKAEAVYIEISKYLKQQLKQSQRFLSEAELNNYLKLFAKDQNQLLSFAQISQSKNVIEACYDNSLFYKGYLLQSSMQLKRLAERDSNALHKYDMLLSSNRRLAEEYSKPIMSRDTLLIIELENKGNLIEKDFARTVSGYREANEGVNWKEIQNNLGPDEAAIEFTHFLFTDQNITDSTIYAALIVTKNNPPKFIRLFEQQRLNNLLKFNGSRKLEYVNDLYTLTQRGASLVEAQKQSLYEMIWKPLEAYLNGINTIYYSPSGLLHRININAIPANETEYLADRYNLVQMNSTRQLVTPTQIKYVKNDALLFGGIQYEQDSSLQHYEPLIATRSRGELSFNNIEVTLRVGSWNYLPGTEREVNSIDNIMKVAGMQSQLKRGYAATEESFKSIGANNNPSPRVLHIATHGYFFNDQKNENVSFSNAEPIFKTSEHPMLRSGLIMTGGNATWQGMKIPEGREDGILTAYEISQMNLSNTELVVLSACETGLGDIQGNEGVYGLQRAFKISGVKYIIMSLWQIPDKQSSQLMITFYKKWLENKMSIPDAFHSAQKELRDIGLDPYQWAGFVLVE